MKNKLIIALIIGLIFMITPLFAFEYSNPQEHNVGDGNSPATHSNPQNHNSINDNSNVTDDDLDDDLEEEDDDLDDDYDSLEEDQYKHIDKFSEDTIINIDEFQFNIPAGFGKAGNKTVKAGIPNLNTRHSQIQDENNYEMTIQEVYAKNSKNNLQIIVNYIIRDGELEAKTFNESEILPYETKKTIKGKEGRFMDNGQECQFIYFENGKQITIQATNETLISDVITEDSASTTNNNEPSTNTTTNTATNDNESFFDSIINFFTGIKDAILGIFS